MVRAILGNTEIQADSFEVWTLGEVNDEEVRLRYKNAILLCRALAEFGIVRKVPLVGMCSAENDKFTVIADFGEEFCELTIRSKEPWRNLKVTPEYVRFLGFYEDWADDLRSVLKQVAEKIGD